VLSAVDLTNTADADLERRFGGLRRLYGPTGYHRIRAARVAVVGVGGVGSWAAEALARSGVAELVLIDMDHVAESNINRQAQALGSTVGMAKVQALAERIADIHPGCRVRAIEEFVAPENWPGLMAQTIDGLIDACDQVRAKETLAAWALAARLPFVTVGAAGGKRLAHQVEVNDLAHTTHDPLLASLRQRLRKFQGAAKAGQGAIGVRCVFSREGVERPEAVCTDDTSVQANLNCHGYGSTVTVTATFGMAAAGDLLEQIVLNETP
jgi:tRNA threonylcarbamoyladenosine dehydratase